jgi:hypothetical protein
MEVTFGIIEQHAARESETRAMAINLAISKSGVEARIRVYPGLFICIKINVEQGNKNKTKFCQIIKKQ